MQPLTAFTLKYFIAALFAIAGLVGCAAPNVATTSPAAVFSLASTPDGKMYKMNTATGATWLVVGEKMESVAHSNEMVLEVGRKYFIERSRSIVYLGDGRFSEPRPDFSALWN
jgi:hypothetical protein